MRAARFTGSTIDAHLHAFVDAVMADEDPPVEGRDGVAGLELTYAAIRSFETVAPVRPGAATP